MGNKKVIPGYKIEELFSVREKVCLISGTGGLGASMARAFAANGARMALANRTKAKADALAEELAGCGAQVRSYGLDVSDKSDCRRCCDEIIKDFGRIDILVNTAAVGIVNDTLHPDEQVFKTTMDTNFYGAVNIGEVCADNMIKNGFGRIIHINSIDSMSVNCFDGAAYAASKAALTQWTKSLAVELAEKNVTVNGIAPIWIWTPMMEKRPGDYMVKAAESVAMKRVSYGDDYVGMALFLASEAANFVTGQTFLVDGGWSINRIFKYSQE